MIKKRGPEKGTSRDAISRLFQDFSWLSFQGFSGAFRGFAPPPEGRANNLPREGKAEKEANSNPQTAGPTFIAKGQPPVQEGMGTTDIKKEGPIGRKGQNPHHKDRTVPKNDRPTPTSRRKGQPPHLEKEGANTNSERRGPTHSEKGGPTFTLRVKS